MAAAAFFSFSASSDETIVASIPLIFPLVLPDDDGRWASSRNLAFVMSILGAGVSTALAGTSRRATVDTSAPDKTLRRERLGVTGSREQATMKGRTVKAFVSIFLHIHTIFTKLRNSRNTLANPPGGRPQAHWHSPAPHEVARYPGGR